MFRLSLVVSLVLIALVYLFRPTGPDNQSIISSKSISPATLPAIEIIAENLAIPWALDWLPDGHLLVTERPGRLVKIGPNQTIIQIDGVEHVGEGGLQGLVVHPNFASNQWIYLYLTTKTDRGLINRVERYRLDLNKLTNKTTIIDNIPGARFHDGGRLAFGPDGMLYITTGDAGQAESASNLNSLAGKILRLNDDGSIPADNPFANPIYSIGHRNPQGIVWDRKGDLWSTEHGRSGLTSGLDEINLIKPGQNYGWPDSQGDTVQSGTIGPSRHSGPDETWAPAGITHLNNFLLFAGLRGEALYQAEINGSSLSPPTAHFFQEFGRLREVKVGPDGFIYITTSNQDGRGTSKANDDKIIKINPATFSQ